MKNDLNIILLFPLGSNEKKHFTIRFKKFSNFLRSLKILNIITSEEEKKIPVKYLVNIIFYKFSRFVSRLSCAQHVEILNFCLINCFSTLCLALMTLSW